MLGPYMASPHFSAVSGGCGRLTQQVIHVVRQTILTYRFHMRIHCIAQAPELIAEGVRLGGFAQTCWCRE